MSRYTMLVVSTLKVTIALFFSVYFKALFFHKTNNITPITL
jgi:hypothetical protein